MIIQGKIQLNLLSKEWINKKSTTPKSTLTTIKMNTWQIRI